MSAAASAIVLHADDDVATALKPLATGETALIATAGGNGKRTLTIAGDIPLCHKFALAALPAGAAVRKYGAVIGTLSRPVEAGEHVHVHNLKSRRAQRPADADRKDAADG